MDERKLLMAAVAGLTVGVRTPAQAQDEKAVETKCYGINGCASHAKCSVSQADLDAAKTLLGEKVYASRFGKSQVHGCGSHAKCGASSRILNWTPTAAGACKAKGGIVIEEADGKKVARKA